MRNGHLPWESGCTRVDITVTVFLYDNARIIEERDGSNNVQATYTYGNYIDEVLTKDAGANRYYYHQNTLWSVHALTDAAGNVVERYTYDAYGTISVMDPLFVSLSSAPMAYFTFTGREFDAETALYHYRARTYGAALGRFYSRDPLGYVDGMNLYEYVRGRVVGMIDPRGLNGNDCGGCCKISQIYCATTMDEVPAFAGTVIFPLPSLNQLGPHEGWFHDNNGDFGAVVNSHWVIFEGENIADCEFRRAIQRTYHVPQGEFHKGGGYGGSGHLVTYNAITDDGPADHEIVREVGGIELPTGTQFAVIADSPGNVHWAEAQMPGWIRANFLVEAQSVKNGRTVGKIWYDLEISVLSWGTVLRNDAWETNRFID